jgi:hypothetical protein
VLRPLAWSDFRRSLKNLLEIQLRGPRVRVGGSRLACDFMTRSAMQKKFTKSLLNTKIIHGMVLKSRRPEEVSQVERNEMFRNIAAPRV